MRRPVHPCLNLKALLTLVAIVITVAGCQQVERRETREAAEIRSIADFHKVYADCQICHQADGGFGAPPVAGMPRWYLAKQLAEFSTGKRGSRRENGPEVAMREAVRNLNTMVEMRGFVTFLSRLPHERSKPDVEGNAEVGSALFELHCNRCHPGGSGSRVAKAPPLVGLPGSYIVRQAANYRDGLRTVDDNDTAGLNMAEAVHQISDEQLRDIAAYLVTLER